jgi:hypothetical protein
MFSWKLFPLLFLLFVCCSSSNKRIPTLNPRGNFPGLPLYPFSSSKDLSFSLFLWFFMFFLLCLRFYFIFIAVFVISYFMIHLTAETGTTKHKKLSLLKLRVRFVSVFLLIARRRVLAFYFSRFNSWLFMEGFIEKRSTMADWSIRIFTSL